MKASGYSVNVSFVREVFFTDVMLCHRVITTVERFDSKGGCLPHSVDS
jgi:hypothetical protein